MSGVIDVGYTASINNSDYLLKEDKSNNQIQITALADGTSGTCVLTQNESGNKINLHLTTPQEKEDWHINFTPLLVNGVPSDNYFYVKTNISGEEGVMSDRPPLYTNWIVNQNRDTINIYIYLLITFTNSDILSWSCLDKDGNAFSPIFNIPDNDYFETRTTGLGSYTLKVVSTPPASSVDTMVLSGRFNPTNKYPLNLNFYLKS